ncbi:aminotransferase class I/II-fold pyridoxal phosphate-dependent enzyme [Rugosimonospora africana]|uniref:Ornithine decarboxylase n=1 Tax=Rugosimonospora africana TaxID=556532 RepID=A0A8J3QVB2_9ACTN|nr:aminotransferase class I/II-fold pyridoxal phosphate-dependent enzyme [Rugosimonospora africana]GIH16475.1 ornithine decarboxylase [Rugosimonospora africana]
MRRQMLDQSVAPILDALAEHRERADASFTPPGHRQGRGIDERVIELLGLDVFLAEAVALGGLDDRPPGQRALGLAEALMAEAVGARHALFSTCGSSLSVKSAMLAVAGPGDRLIVDRNTHKSVIYGIILAGIEPIWIGPGWDADAQLPHPPGVAAIGRALDREPAAKGVLLVSPTGYGTCADLAAIARLCHERDRVLVVDEAWGAHLPFHPDLPRCAMHAGADLAVTSGYKMGGGLEQGSVYQLRGDRIDPAVLKLRADLLGTGSPSPAIHAALDGWRRQMVERGRELLGHALRLSRQARAGLDELPELAVAGRDLVGPGRSADFDPLQVVVDVSGAGVGGADAAGWLREQAGVEVGAVDHRRIVARLTYADSEQTVRQLLAGLRRLVNARSALPAAVPVDLPDPAELEPEVVMLPRDAFFGNSAMVPASQATGRVAAETITPYPPGIPAVVPGERISEAVLDYLRAGVATSAMRIPDAADPTLETMKVVCA